MKGALVIVGVVILIIGIGITAYGFGSPMASTKTTTTTTSVAVVRDTNRTVSPLGFWGLGAQNLSPGQVITGKVSISNYSQSLGAVFFYVQNESTFIAWGACAPCSATNALNQTIPSSGSYSFSWTVPAAGSYYFVLDDSNYNSSAPATFVASSSASVPGTVSTTNANTTVEYAGLGIAVLGAIILGGGLVMSATTRKPVQSST